MEKVPSASVTEADLPFITTAPTSGPALSTTCPDRMTGAGFVEGVSDFFFTMRIIFPFMTASVPVPSRSKARASWSVLPTGVATTLDGLVSCSL